MATTIVPAFDEPIDPDLDVERLRADAKEWLDSAQGDCDKAGTVEDAAYYEGVLTSLTWLLQRLTGQEPSDD